MVGIGLSLSWVIWGWINMNRPAIKHYQRWLTTIRHCEPFFLSRTDTIINQSLNPFGQEKLGCFISWAWNPATHNHQLLRHPLPLHHHHSITPSPYARSQAGPAAPSWRSHSPQPLWPPGCSSLLCRSSGHEIWEPLRTSGDANESLLLALRSNCCCKQLLRLTEVVFCCDSCTFNTIVYYCLYLLFSSNVAYGHHRITYFSQRAVLGGHRLWCYKSSHLLSCSMFLSPNSDWTMGTTIVRGFRMPQPSRPNSWKFFTGDADTSTASAQHQTFPTGDRDPRDHLTAQLSVVKSSMLSINWWSSTAWQSTAVPKGCRMVELWILS